VLPRLEGTQKADIAIIGGGFTGLSAALHLAEQGCDVALLEAREPGWGASGRNGGQVNAGLKLDRRGLQRVYGEALGADAYDTGAGAPDFLFELIRRHGIDCDAAQFGTMRLAHTDRALAALGAAAEVLAAEGVATQRLDRGEAARMTGTTRYLGGLLDPRGGCVHPLRLCRGLATAALGKGARLFGHSPATALKRQDGSWQIQTPQGTLLAGQVLLATDAYTDGLWPGLQSSVLPVNSFQIATAPLPAEHLATIIPGRQSIYDSRRLILYFRVVDNRLVMGGRASFSVAENRSTDYAVMRRVVAGLYPQLAEIPIDFAWAGRISITLDHLPHLWEAAPGLHVAMGYNGRGVAMATRLGAIAANHLANPGRPVPFPISASPRIPGQGLRQPALHAAMLYHRMMDIIGY
jgi:sarcosine oxidase